MTSECTKHEVICAQKHAKKMLELQHLDLIGLLSTEHIIAYITMIYRGL